MPIILMKVEDGPFTLAHLASLLYDWCQILQDYLQVRKLFDKPHCGMSVPPADIAHYRVGGNLFPVVR